MRGVGESARVVFVADSFLVIREPGGSQNLARATDITPAVKTVAWFLECLAVIRRFCFTQAKWLARSSGKT